MLVKKHNELMAKYVCLFLCLCVCFCVVFVFVFVRVGVCASSSSRWTLSSRMEQLQALVKKHDELMAEYVHVFMCECIVCV